jgi:hypothetical protein
LGTPEGGAVSLPDDGVFAEAALLGRLPSEHGGSRAGVVWAERAAVSLSAALGGEAEAASLELKPVDGAGGGSFSVPLAEGGAGLLDFGGDGGIAQPAAQQDFHDRGDGSRPAGVVAAGGYEAKPRAGSIGLGAVGDGDGAVTSRAAELAARTRALSARLAERDRAMAADPSLAAAVREAERAGPLRRRA